jgi:hypothetical protein
MKAIRVHEFGGPEVLKLEEAATPKPSAGEVLVRIHAAGVPSASREHWFQARRWNLGTLWNRISCAISLGESARI